MLLPELQSLASSLGISGTGRMRKGELIAAIQERQGGEGRVPGPRGTDAREVPAREVPARVEAPREEVRAEVREAEPTVTRGDHAAPAAESNGAGGHGGDARGPRRASRPAGPPDHRPERAETDERPARQEGGRTDTAERDSRRDNRDNRTDQRNERSERGGEQRSERGGEQRNERGGEQRNERGADQRPDRGADQRGDRDGDDEDGGNRRGRRSRFRDRRRGRGEGGGGSERAERSGGGGSEPQVSEDDVLVPVAGIVDVLDNYAFVRTSGYLSGSNDVYVSMTQIKRYGLRRGDAVTGAVRTARDNDSGQGSSRRDKYNPLVRLDTINGMDPEEARRRPEFFKLTPLYPHDRLPPGTQPPIPHTP